MENGQPMNSNLPLNSLSLRCGLRIRSSQSEHVSCIVAYPSWRRKSDPPGCHNTPERRLRQKKKCPIHYLECQIRVNTHGTRIVIHYSGICIAGGILSSSGQCQLNRPPNEVARIFSAQWKHSEINIENLKIPLSGIVFPPHAL